MSISFIPTAGLWNEHSYSAVDLTQDYTGLEVRNGMIRFDEPAPCVHCHNAGGHWVLRTLGLHDEPSGEATSGEVERLIDRALTALRDGHDVAYDEDSYEARKLHAMLAMLRHCKFHGCGFTWG